LHFFRNGKVSIAKGADALCANMRVTAFLGLYRAIKPGQSEEKAFSIMKPEFGHGNWKSCTRHRHRLAGIPIGGPPRIRRDLPEPWKARQAAAGETGVPALVEDIAMRRSFAPHIDELQKMVRGIL
jgi:hypothetical protein